MIYRKIIKDYKLNILMQGRIRMDAEELWETVRKTMMEEISQPSFETWVELTVAIALNDENLIVESESKFQKQWLYQRYEREINAILNDVSSEKITVVFTVENEDDSMDDRGLMSTTNRYDELVGIVNELNIRVEHLEDEVRRLKNLDPEQVR